MRFKRTFYLFCFLFVHSIDASSFSLQHHHHNIESKCSRQNSKVVREFFVKALLPIYNKYSVAIPNECKYSPLNDIYYNHENNKTCLDTYKWKCEYCGKIFLEEKYLDLHFHNKHNKTLNLGQNGEIYCLANLCKIFRCDVVQNTKLNFIKKQGCNEGTLQHLKQDCYNLVQECIPQSTPFSIQQQIESELNRELCAYLTCSKYHDLPSFMNQGPSFIKIFLIVVFFGLCIIVYGVLNHTDLIFTENEQPIVEAPLDDVTAEIIETLTPQSNQNNSHIRLRKPNTHI